MAIRYLFNSSGEYVALVRGINVFLPSCEWVEFIFDGNDFYGKDGS